jgi:hypothetical protein
MSPQLHLEMDDALAELAVDLGYWASAPRSQCKRLSPGERNDNFGSGLIDPLQDAATGRSENRDLTPRPPMRPIQQR